MDDDLSFTAFACIGLALFPLLYFPVMTLSSWSLVRRIRRTLGYMEELEEKHGPQPHYRHQLREQLEVLDKGYWRGAIFLFAILLFAWTVTLVVKETIEYLV